MEACGPFRRSRIVGMGDLLVSSPCICPTFPAHPFYFVNQTSFRERKGRSLKFRWPRSTLSPISDLGHLSFTSHVIFSKTRCCTPWNVRRQGDIHSSILALGRKYANGEVTGATARAVAMLMAFKQVVMDYSTPPDKVLVRFMTVHVRRV